MPDLEKDEEDKGDEEGDEGCCVDWDLERMTIVSAVRWLDQEGGLTMFFRYCEPMGSYGQTMPQARGSQVTNRVRKSTSKHHRYERPTKFQDHSLGIHDLGVIVEDWEIPRRRRIRLVNTQSDSTHRRHRDQVEKMQPGKMQNTCEKRSFVGEG